jgi:UDP-N-acetyl-2-amino-2-deoxyglucuronate dehydrogenase
MNEIRLGIIGSGFMGRTNAETITKYLPGARLVSIAGGSRAPQLASDYKVECDPDVDKLVQRADIDAVFISTPHSQHTAHAVAAANAGKHILLDKPMAASVAECDQILEATRRNNINLMIMFGQRFRLVNREAYRLIQEGAVGRIQAISACALNSGGLASLPPWQSLPENLGTFFGHGIHNIDQVRWFTGDEVATVAACVQREPPSNNEVSTMAVLGLRSGVMANVWVSWTIPPPNFPHSAFSARVVGDLGILDLDAYSVLRLGRGSSWSVIAEQSPIDFKGKGMLDPVRMEAYAAQGQEFVASIHEHRRPSVTGEDGRAAVEVALAAYQSAKERRTVIL